MPLTAAEQLCISSMSIIIRCSMQTVDISHTTTRIYATAAVGKVAMVLLQMAAAVVNTINIMISSSSSSSMITEPSRVHNIGGLLLLRQLLLLMWPSAATAVPRMICTTSISIIATRAISMIILGAAKVPASTTALVGMYSCTSITTTITMVIYAAAAAATTATAIAVGEVPLAAQESPQTFVPHTHLQALPLSACQPRASSSAGHQMEDRLPLTAATAAATAPAVPITTTPVSTSSMGQVTLTT
jgi:hypothetical protein